MNAIIPILAGVWHFLAENSAEFISALGGAFFGAWFANLLQNRTEATKELDENHFAIVRAQLALAAQAGTLLNIQQQCLDPLRSDPARAQKMIQFTHIGTDLRVDLAPLAFILMTSEADLLQQVHLAECGYLTALNCLRDRNAAYDRLFKQSQLESMDLKTGHCTVVASGFDIKRLQDLTDALYDSVDRALIRCKKNVEELSRVGKTLFPKRKFILMQPLEVPKT